MKILKRTILLILLLSITMNAKCIDNRVCHTVKNDIIKLFKYNNYNYLDEYIGGYLIGEFLPLNSGVKFDNGTISKSDLIKHFNAIFTKERKQNILNANVMEMDLSYVIVIPQDIEQGCEKDNKNYDSSVCDGSYMLHFRKKNNRYELYIMRSI